MENVKRIELPPTRMEREFGEAQARRSVAFQAYTQRRGMPMTYGAGKEVLPALDVKRRD